ncbi:MAG: twin-arginine translocase subunit TatB [Thiotrichales bacterium]|nr:twin-arginine translocase subunit TatB [Thiotrichales bacterium]
MFDIGFLELMMILIIALIVIGPERMPEVARKLGSFMGKTRRFIDSVKQDSQIQETLNDFKQSVNLEAEKQKLDNLQNDLQESMKVGVDPSRLEEFNLADFQRPFGNSSEGGSQFSRAPSQPQVAGSAETTSVAPDPNRASITSANPSAPSSPQVKPAEPAPEQTHHADTLATVAKPNAPTPTSSTDSTKS